MFSLRRLLVLPMIAVFLFTTICQSAPLSAQGTPVIYLPLIQGGEASSVSATITPQGGELATPDKRVRLVVPAGAVAEPVTVVFTWNGNAPQMSGLTSLSSAFNLTARTSQGQAVTQFAKPLQLQIQLGDSGLQGSSLYYYDMKQQHWVSLQSSFDTQSGVLTGTTEHFTTFVAASEMCGVGVGDGVPTEVKSAFLAAYERNGSLLGMGDPETCVTRWSTEEPVHWVQDFAEMPWGKSLIFWNPVQKKAYMVRGWIRNLYTGVDDNSKKGPDSWLGAPISDETVASSDIVSLDTSPNGQHPWSYGGEPISYFERGYISRRQGESSFAANTYHPALCDVSVSVADAGSGHARLQVSAYVDRAPGWPTADQVSDPIDGYFTVIFPDGTKRWASLDQVNKDALSATITTFGDIPLAIGQTVNFYLDVYNRRGADQGWKPGLRTFPKNVAIDPGWNQVDSWTSSREGLKELTLQPGVNLSPANDNWQCSGDLGGPGDSGGGNPRPRFVYVALGDSYQSGEGTGSSPNDTTTAQYQNMYENGSNYSFSVGIPANTYGFKGGNGCHRSLSNYAKLNRDKFKPGADIFFIDVTCSGATIETSSGKPIVGNAGSSQIDPASQVTQAKTKLSLLGLTANDVDLVTVGMGGNDADFSKIIAACLLPNIVRRALSRHPDSPDDWSVIANFVATCEIADKHIFKTGPAIEELTNKETWAQEKLLQTFGRAQVLQLNYPNILPVKSVAAPAWCGGVRKEDLDFARGKVAQINGIIANTISSTAASNARYRIVNVQAAFGSNPLCPSSSSAAYANGISETNFDAELGRLLNLDGNGDAEARKRIDKLISDYRTLKDCVLEHYSPLGPDCDEGQARNRIVESGNSLLQYLTEQKDSAILPNLIAPPSSGEDAYIRRDRSDGLFHPNARGQLVLACYVHAAYTGAAPGDCSSASTSTGQVGTVNGSPLSNTPIGGGVGVQVRIQIGGFAANVTVHIKIFSTPIDLGTVTSDSNGVVDTVVTLPDVPAGVHTIELQGDSPAGTGIYQRVRVAYPGRPSGDGGYDLYVPGFTPNTGDGSQLPEKIDITYYGELFDTLTPDEEGGVFIELPLYDHLTMPNPVAIIAKSQSSGKMVTTIIDPIPSIIGFWATDTEAGALSVTGRGTTVDGRVHSGADITIHGNGTSFTGGIEYGTQLVATGNNNNLLSSRQISPGGLPLVRKIADYQPGGTEALHAGANYHPIPEASCANGVWNVRAENVPSGIVYVPCSISISGSNTTITALLVSEGAIRIRGNDITVAPESAGMPALLTSAIGKSAIRVDGSGIQIRGTIQALAGDVYITGSAGTFRCGVIAKSIKMSGSDNRVEVDEQCRVR